LKKKEKQQKIIRGFRGSPFLYHVFCFFSYCFLCRRVFIWFRPFLRGHFARTLAFRCQLVLVVIPKWDGRCAALLIFFPFCLFVVSVWGGEFEAVPFFWKYTYCVEVKEEESGGKITDF